ncbi:septation protein spoVG [Eubacterium sp. AF36-5BH]|uniref:SpoVG family protein n=1 Tax=Eubacterium sp. AF36-5BH TaxID=2293108 RepID=UPI000E497613|nr:SpoVG family protein [Eubacterium sp. AF36-5BH]RGF49431.1 septation protein spoVG [Eubacterium sp. AF36-5BH]
MKYTVKVNKVRKNEGNLRGFATVVFGESFKVTNIAILENSEGNLFVSMPRYRSSEVDEKNNYIYKDICNPITREFRTELYDAILDGYKNAGNENREVTKEANELEMPSFAVKVTPYEREGNNIKGLARIYLDDSFVINNVSVIQGKNDVFVAMPSYKTKQTDKDGKAVYQDICFPITKEFRERLYREIVETYKEEKAKAVDSAHPIKKDEFMQVSDKEEGLPIR